MPRKAFKRDPPGIVMRRLVTGTLLRKVLYGGRDVPWPRDSQAGSKFTPAQTAHNRRMEWGFKVREFVMYRTFRYSELFALTREFVQQNGPWVGEGREDDIKLIKAWEAFMYDAREKMGRSKWVMRETDEPEEIARRAAEAKAEERHFKMLKAGVCPLCAGDLPCAECGIEEWKIVSARLKREGEERRAEKRRAKEMAGG